jgi:hypothetical protein
MRKLGLILLCLFLGGFQLAFGQNRVITGRITSAADGSTYPGVTVTVPGTTIGGISDLDGNYSIRVPEEATELQFKYVGMKTLTVPIEGRSVIDVQMEEDVLGLEEVHIQGLHR